MTFVAPRPADLADPLWPVGVAGVVYGGDYNPEQWPDEVWEQDAELMRQAGVNLVSVAIHSWVLLEPRPGEFDFGWLDRLLDLLHGAGVSVNLATPTVVPPAWLYRAHPEIRPVTRDGVVLERGSRATFCPSAPAYRRAAARIARAVGERYAAHPALAMWHVHNEYGAPVGACYCPESATAFRAWLRERHGSLEALNTAWGTTFWGQRYGDWDEVEPPRATATAGNPAQELDFLRFCSDELLACYRAERDVLREHSSAPVTTNFMTTNCKSVDYWRWGREVDVVANDHYLTAEADRNHIDLAMSADLTRAVAGGRPWMLMEHSTGAVNWQPRNIAKRPGELARNSLAHVARGADAVMFFQWRASRFGAEKFHSAMLPHSGTRSRVWRDVVRLGADLGSLAELRGSLVRADVAVVWDWESWWALELAWRPSVDLDYRERVAAFYEQLWDAHLTCDFVAPGQDLAGYRLVVAPSLYLTAPGTAAVFGRYVRDGGTLVVSYFSGIVDDNDAVHPGGHPGALREVLGLEVEEFLPLRAGERVSLSGGATGDVWAENLRPHGAETVLEYADGPAAGKPAVTRHRLGGGSAWYLSTRLRGDDLAGVLRGAYRDAGVEPADLPRDVEVVRRHGPDAEYLFVLNHTDVDARIEASGTELLTGGRCDGLLTVPAGTVAVLRTG
ncbi:beta-galactosidase [Saccharothrix longispora]|uniref:Beta-galactosidase n=1 Tax=Saccharothrix longispora TaxID=33920 RepID=A0ABU1PVZ7_9PSEU|nr:beta-galactosidase [Saccharothrix longispora]MDR6594812.1 beta-galactosidase [Saccharothrix longispora]